MHLKYLLMVFLYATKSIRSFLWPKRGTRLVDLWTFSAFDFNFDFVWQFLCRDSVLFLASVTLVLVTDSFGVFSPLCMAFLQLWMAQVSVRILNVNVIAPKQLGSRFFFLSLNCPRASMHLQDSFVFPFGFDFHLAVCPPIEAVVDFSEFVCKLIACGISVIHDDPP